MRRLLKFKCDKDRAEVLIKYDVERKAGDMTNIEQ